MKKQMSDVEKARCLGWLEEGATQKQCAKRLGVHVNTIKRLVSKNKSTKEDIPQRKIGSGRPRKLTQQAIKTIKKALQKNPSLTAKSLKTLHPDELKDISLRTIRRVILVDLKLGSFVTRKKPFLSKSMKIKRLKFARKYIKWTAKDWGEIVFTDESMVQTSCQNISRRVRRKWGEGSHDPKYCIQIFKNPEQIMIWTSFSGTTGPGKIYILPPKEKMNAAKYQEVLKTHLKPNKKIILQDRAPPHRAKSTLNFLKENKIQNIFIPPSSPDLNPIENAFSALKRELESEDVSSMRKLKSSIKKKWGSMERGYFQNLSHSMPRRLREVIRKSGAMTKY